MRYYILGKKCKHPRCGRWIPHGRLCRAHRRYNVEWADGERRSLVERTFGLDATTILILVVAWGLFELAFP